MHRFRQHILLVATLGVACVGPPASATTTPARQSLAAELLQDAADGKLDQHSLLVAALIAEGIADRNQLDQLHQQFDHHRRQLIDQVATIDNPSQLAPAVFDYLHQRILQGEYRSDCSWLSESLRNGHYNCLSATILYQCLCRELNVPVQGMERPEHVFCRLTGKRRHVVEATCPSWFSKNRELAAAGTVEDARDETIAANPISELQLIARMYYNRGIDYVDRQQFAAAVSSIEVGLQIDPTHAASQRNLRATLNNWALACAQQQQFERAVGLLARLMDLDPEFEPLLVNDLHIHQQWVLHLCEQREYAQALDVLCNGHERRPTAQLFDRGRFALYEEWAAHNLEENDPAAAAEVFALARHRHGPCRDVLDAEAATFGHHALLRQQQGHPAQARQLLATALSRQPDSRFLHGIQGQLGEQPN